MVGKLAGRFVGIGDPCDLTFGFPVSSHLDPPKEWVGPRGNVYQYWRESPESTIFIVLDRLLYQV